MDGGIVGVIGSKGCSRLFVGSPISVASIKNMKSSGFMPSSSPSTISGFVSVGPTKRGPFNGLVICVTGLPKEARQQVMAAAERLGGQYSSSLHPGCTHLVVQSCVGRKFEHALKHGQRNGLFVVTLGWFVDCVRRNVRLNESQYAVKNVGGTGFPLLESNGFGLPGTENSCLPLTHIGDEKSYNTVSNTHQLHRQPLRKDCSSGSLFFSDFIFIDPDMSVELRKKVVNAASKEGAKFLDHWFIGSRASHIVCESPSIQKYIGHANSLVTPLWVFKSVKEKCLQRLVHLSSDLVRQIALILENHQMNQTGQVNSGGSGLHSRNSSYAYERIEDTLEERQKYMELAKMGVRIRRSRRMQSCQMPLHPITPSSLLDSLCWSVSEPTSSACIFPESSEVEDANSVFYDAKTDGRDSEAPIESFSRLLRESERNELIFKNHFLTILFPIDRFGELGPSSRTFFSDSGFTCSQVLDHIYNFYQDNISADEAEVAIHTDSGHADKLRSLYAGKEALEQGFVRCRRIEFLGSRRYFEALKRISGQNNSSCYELLLRA